MPRAPSRPPPSTRTMPVRRLYEHLWSLFVVCGMIGFVGYTVLFGGLVTYCVIALSAVAQPICITLVGAPYKFTTLAAETAFANVTAPEACNLTVTMFSTTNGCESFGIILSTSLLTGLLAVVRAGIVLGTVVGSLCAMGSMLFLAVRGEFRARYWPWYVVAGLAHLTAWGIIQFLGSPPLYAGTLVSYSQKGATNSLLVCVGSNVCLGLLGLIYLRGPGCCRRSSGSEADASANSTSPPNRRRRLSDDLSRPMLDAQLIIIPRLDVKQPKPPVDKAALRDGLGVKRIIPQSEAIKALQDGTCCICLETYDLRPQSPVAIESHARPRCGVETPCGHYLHIGCLIDLFAGAPQGPSSAQPCPLCRNMMFLETCRRLEVVDWECDEAL